MERELAELSLFSNGHSSQPIAEQRSSSPESIIFTRSARFFVLISLTAVRHALPHEQNVCTLVQFAPNGILVVDASGRITVVNPSLEQQFGYSADELLGREVELLVPDRSEKPHRLLCNSYNIEAHSDTRSPHEHELLGEMDPAVDDIKEAVREVRTSVEEFAHP